MCLAVWPTATIKEPMSYKIIGCASAKVIFILKVLIECVYRE